MRVFSVKRKKTLREFVRDLMLSKIIHESIFSEKNVCPSSWNEKWLLDAFEDSTREYFQRKKTSVRWPETLNDCLMLSQIVHECIFSEKNVCPLSWNEKWLCDDLTQRNILWCYMWVLFTKTATLTGQGKHSQQWPLIAATTIFVHISHRCSSICAALGWQHRR